MYKSNEEYFEAVEILISELERCGNKKDSTQLHDGFRCINGLTDGWAVHLDSLLKLEENNDESLTEAQLARITRLCDSAYHAVYREKRHVPGRKPWWMFW